MLLAPLVKAEIMEPPPKRIKLPAAVGRTDSTVGSRRPRSEPFGQHIFGAAADLHPLVQGRGVRAAVRQQIVPGEQLAGFRLDRLADGLEPRRAAVLRLVEIDHRRPGTLPNFGGVDVEIIATRLERVGVRFELLPRRITLPLQRLACGKGQPEQLGDLSINFADLRVAPVEVASLAGAEIGDSKVIGDLRRPPLRIDPFDQHFAGGRIEEAADDEQLKIARGDPLRARR